MTKNKALNQSLSKPNQSDWLIPDFLNLECVDDMMFDLPIRVKHLTENQAKIALGISINYINRLHTKIQKIKNIF